MKTTVYLYCRNEAPYLSRDAISGEKYVLSDTKDYFNRGDLNGFVCFRCECEEAFDLSGPMDDAERYLDLTKAHDLVEYYGMRIALTYDQLKGRRGGSKSLWGLRFENVKAIRPLPIDCFYEDEDCAESLEAAPEGWRWAYADVRIDKETYLARQGIDREMQSGDCYFRVDKVMILSVAPERLRAIADGEVDLEPMTDCPDEIKVGVNAACAERQSGPKDYQGAVAALRDYVGYHDCHCGFYKPEIGERALETLQSLADKEKPMEVICDNDDPNCELPVGNHDCPRCGYGLETLVVDGNDKENIPSHFHYCPKCGQRLSYPKEDK